MLDPRLDLDWTADLAAAIQLLPSTSFCLCPVRHADGTTTSVLGVNVAAMHERLDTIGLIVSPDVDGHKTLDWLRGLFPKTPDGPQVYPIALLVPQGTPPDTTFLKHWTPIITPNPTGA